MFLAGRHGISPLGGKNWEVDDVAVYRGKYETFVIRPGFITDLASTPGFLAWLFPAADQAYLLAAILHDYLCRVEVPAERISSHDADGLFLRVLQEEGVKPVKAHLMWAAVRIGSLFQKSRRQLGDFWKDLPAVLRWSLVGVPIVVPGAIGALFGTALLALVEQVAHWSRLLLRH
jgi:hypothetical protein